MGVESRTATVSGMVCSTLNAFPEALTLRATFHSGPGVYALGLFCCLTLPRHSLGLVASRGHVSSYGGLARKDGTLFAVTLKPGHRARLRYDDLRHKWRDLASDIASGTRTAWHFLQGLNSHSQPGKARVELHNLKAWAVRPGTTEPPLRIDCKATVEEYVYSLDLLSTTHPRRRAEQVDRYAQALAAGYGDSTNLNFWRWVLWRAIEGDHRGEGTLYQLQNALTRLKADVAEWEGLKRPGALLVKRLRECGLWDALTQLQPVR